MYQLPDAVEKTEGTIDPLITPVQVLFGRCGEQREQSGGVGSVFPDQRIRVDDIPFGLAHLGPILDYHTLGQQVEKGLIAGYIAHVTQHLGEKTGVEQVHDGMFDATDILVYRHPVIDLGAVKGCLQQIRTAVAQEIPGRLHKGIHGIRLATGGNSADRTGYINKRIQPGQGTATFTGKFNIYRQCYREILFRNRYDTTDIAVDDRNGIAPIALPGDAPVAQTIVDRLRSDPLALH